MQIWIVRTKGIILHYQLLELLKNSKSYGRKTDFLEIRQNLPKPEMLPLTNY